MSVHIGATAAMTVLISYSVTSGNMRGKFAFFSEIRKEHFHQYIQHITDKCADRIADYIVNTAVSSHKRLDKLYKCGADKAEYYGSRKRRFFQDQRQSQSQRDKHNNACKK